MIGSQPYSFPSYFDMLLLVCIIIMALEYNPSFVDIRSRSVIIDKYYEGLSVEQIAYEHAFLYLLLKVVI